MKPRSLLFLALSLLLLAFLFLDYASRHSEAIVLFEVLVLVNVAPDEEVWVRFLQLVEEAVVDDGDLVDVDEGQLLAILDQVADAEVSDLLALAELNVLKVGHGFDQHGEHSVADRRATDLERVQELQAWLDSLVAHSD